MNLLCFYYKNSHL